jgi:membrane protease YdiL (CAAX protease family)
MFVERYAGYAVGACLQQFLLQDFFLPRLLRLLRSPGSAALMAAAMFSLAHLPNPILTVITFFWGFAACLFFLHYRNLYTLAIAHTILGITVAMTVPGPVIHNMRVGIGYLTYSSHHGHQRNH